MLKHFRLLNTRYYWYLPNPPSPLRSGRFQGSSIHPSIIRSRRSRSYYLCTIAMSNPAGVLKVVVVQGKRLVIRDFRSSDPYVIVKLGNQLFFQIAKTKVINSCLNPVWDEEIAFSLTEPVGALNLEVFDKDRFKADDKMGHAHLNIQPLVSAARLKQALKVSAGEITLRKVIPDNDNCLVRESCINCVNGDVVQNVWLRLCGVESGEIELKLKLVNPGPVPFSS